MRALLVVLALASVDCGHAAAGPSSEPAAGVRTAASATRERGRASWYGARHQGRPTASGEPFDQHALTAAHRTLPFGSRVRVTSLATGKSVIVRINDRGPRRKGFVIDVSFAAARRLGMVEAGVVACELEVVSRPR